MDLSALHNLFHYYESNEKHEKKKKLLSNWIIIMHETGEKCTYHSVTIAIIESKPLDASMWMDDDGSNFE